MGSASAPPHQYFHGWYDGKQLIIKLIKAKCIYVLCVGMR